MNFAFLHYSTYKRCPLQYKWRFVKRPDVPIIIDKRNAFIGLLLQKLVERFYRENWWSDRSVLARMRNAIPLVSQQITDSEKIRWEANELASWLQVAHDTVPSILSVVRSEKLLGEQNYSELELDCKLGEDTLQARLDVLIVREGISTLLEGKGGKTVGRYIDKDQPYYYSLVARSLLKRLPHRIGFWWYRHRRIIWLPVSNEKVEEVGQRAASMLESIKREQFEPTPSSDCRLCDFRDICEVGQNYLSSRHIVADVEIPNNFGEVSF